MDNLPNNPSNPNSGNNPPPFSSGFNPHTNPINSSNPYQTQPSPVPNPIPQSSNYPNLPNNPNTTNSPLSSEVSVKEDHHSTYSEVAQHKLRDSHGRFASDHLFTESNSIPEPASDSKPLLTRIIDYIKQYFKKLTIKKVLTIASFIYLITTNGPLQNAIEWFFPYSSPILHRQVAHQGLLQTSGNGSYSLVLPDKSVYSLYFKPSPSLINLKKLNEVVVKGNLTWQPYVIENAEVYPLNISTP